MAYTVEPSAVRLLGHPLPLRLELGAMCSPRQWGSRVGRFFLLAIVTVAHVHAASTELRHLRYMLTMAKQLNRTLVWTGIKKHYTDRTARFHIDQVIAAPSPPAPSPPEGTFRGQAAPTTAPSRCFKEEIPDFIEFSEVLDRCPGVPQHQLQPPSPAAVSNNDTTGSQQSDVSRPVHHTDQ
ncbi:hypothetical protein HaLaN_16901, partial [Haematococcus lacustris]